ncbi:holo-ACP synthase [Micromonospora sp. NPDC005203]|uniref:holo-ACP synthase n=1 Tax=Micromonospora sp. NPDC005203 TaxID=3364226 RepID=UPI003696D6BB
MGVRVGVDLVEVDRVQTLLKQQPAASSELFTERELAACSGRRDRYVRLAGRFAAKEAVLKALGTGLGPRMRWTDVEIVNEPWGKPRVHLYGEVAAVWRRRGAGQVEISISHTAGLALAHAVLVETAACACVSGHSAVTPEPSSEVHGDG